MNLKVEIREKLKYYVRESNFEIWNSNKKKERQCQIIKSGKMWSVKNDPIIIIVVWNVMLNKARVKKEHIE
jgi:hypothetical protein